MHVFYRVSRLVIVVALIVTPVFAQEPVKTGGTTPSMPGMADDKNAASGTLNSADRDMMAGMAKMNHAMSAAPMTGDPTATSSR